MSRKIVQEKKVYGVKESQKALTQEALNQRIKEVARELYKKRGGGPGHELDDWLEAERLVKKELSRCS